MNIRAILALALAILAACGEHAFAQSSATPVVTGYLTTSGCGPGQTSCFVQYGLSGPTVTVAVSPVTTTPVGGTVTTHGTFQTALASSATRKGCLVVNTSTDVEYVFFGANGSATEATSIPLAAAAVAGGQGGSLSCAVGGLAVATDNLAITSLSLIHI